MWKVSTFDFNSNHFRLLFGEGDLSGDEPSKTGWFIVFDSDILNY